MFPSSAVLKSAPAGEVVELPEEGMEEGYGTGESSSAAGGAASKELVRRCNLHSSMVLKALNWIRVSTLWLGDGCCACMWKRYSVV